MKKNPGSIEKHQNITVVYTKEAETADSYIERVSHTLVKDGRVRVATSDGFEQMIILAVFMLIGFVLGKARLVNPKHAGILSTVLIFVCSPCVNIRTFSANFTAAYISEHYLLLLAAIAVIGIMHPIGWLIVKPLTKEHYEREVWRYSLVMPNFGFMGIAVVGGALGEAALLDFIVFTLPFTVYVYAVAYPILTKSKFSVKNFITPAMLSILIGAVLGLLQVELPATVMKVINPFADVMGPLSMILSGVVISEYSWKDLLLNRNVYIVTVLRLLVIPVLLGVPALLILPPSMGLIVVIFSSLACGLNTVVFPKLVGENCKYGAGLALVSSVVSYVTVPIIVDVFTKIFIM